MISFFSEGDIRQMNSIPSYTQMLKHQHSIGKYRYAIFPIFSIALLSISAGSAWSQDRASDAGRPKGDWQVILGGGALVAPEYEGGDELTVYPIPYFSITWKDRVFLNLERGLGVYAYRDDHFRVGGSVGYARGRDEDDADRLRGLGDIEDAARGQLFAKYSLGRLDLGLNLAKDFGGTDGFQIRPTVGMTYALSQRIKISPELSVTWANDDYMQNYFGISPTQAARSVLQRFDAEAGFNRADLKIAATWDITDSWFTTANVGFGYLLGDSADSPITDSRFQPSVGLFVGYKF